MYFADDKRKSFPRLCQLANPRAANEMILVLAAGMLAGGATDVPDQAIRKSAEAVERMLDEITGEDERPNDAFSEDDEG